MIGPFGGSRKASAVSLVVALLLPACISGSTGEPVEGTSASVNGKTTSPLHEGQYIGQLELTDSGCEGSSGSGGSEAYEVSLFIDHECRVFVESIEPSSED